QLVSQVRPSYTAIALDRRIQGSVVLEVVVTASGLPSQMRVMRSLDEGLDEEAIKAVREWKFTPGRLSGTPVPVVVTIVLDFTIRGAMKPSRERPRARADVRSGPRCPSLPRGSLLQAASHPRAASRRPTCSTDDRSVASRDAPAPEAATAIGSVSATFERT